MGNIVLLFFLFLILGAGAYYDVREHRIPNHWVVFGIVMGAFLSTAAPLNSLEKAVFWAAPLLFFLRMILVSALFFPLFYCRMVGAGDVKLAALLCGYLGLRSGILAVSMGFLVGALWSFYIMAKNRSFLNRFSYLLAYIRQTIQTGKVNPYYIPARDGDGIRNGTVIPLGACIFLGTLIYLILENLLLKNGGMA